jgi:hypothetical protein
MLVNLLARSEGIVENVVLMCPEGVRLAGRTVPLARRNVDLASALIAGAAAVDTVPVALVSSPPPSADVRFVIGPGEPVEEWRRVHGERWWGGLTSGPMPGTCDSALPLGPYTAACLAAAEVFRAVRVPGYQRLDNAFYSLASFIAFARPPTEADDLGPPRLDGLRVRATLAGVGAVGSTWVHTAWATPGISGRAVLADADELGVDVTNLNRCPVFARSSIGKRKATEAAAVCEDAPIVWDPHDGPVGSATGREPLMLSAVDTNTSRQAVQSLYPARLISASTLDMRAEVLRCDPRAGTACIRCFNPPETGPSGHELRRRFLAMPKEQQESLAAELGATMEEAHAWAREGVCGYVGDRLAATMRPSTDGAGAFAVGFVSVMAGLMLAAQTFHEAMGTGPLIGATSRAVMTLLNPVAQSNYPRPFGRQADCPMCDPCTAASTIWRRRYEDANRPT